MSEKPTYLTVAGKQKLEEELEFLRTVRRPAVARQIHDAKEGGDIMENAGYDEAKNEQAFVEGRIMTLETLLSKAEIIADPKPGSAVSIGSKVVVLERDCSPEAYYIVGSTETDPLQGRISDESPLGRSLMGHHAGDKVVVHAPAGSTEFEILDVT
jgi:transcription elongation factor GreA